jgi:DNA repair protein RadC
VRNWDYHAGSQRTGPTPRPLLLNARRKAQVIQIDARDRSLLHNHPSGDPTPSQADIHMTKSIIDIATPLGIAVHDHIIVGKNGHASLKGLKLI